MTAYAPDVVAVASGSYYNMQPPAGSEIIVHNVPHSAAAELEKYDSVAALAITVDAHSAAGAWMGLQLHCTHTVYYRVKNTSAGTNSIGPDGVVSL